MSRVSLHRCLPAIWLGLVACATEPQLPSAGDLDGQWGWEWNGNPGGSSINISLSTAGTSVSGTGQVCGVGPLCEPGAVTITGRRASHVGPFTLTMTGSGNWSARYTGHFEGLDRMSGTWSRGGDSVTVALNRCGKASLCW
jgi:hypothetical protein